MSRTVRVCWTVWSWIVGLPFHVDFDHTTCDQPAFCPCWRTSYHRWISPAAGAASAASATFGAPGWTWTTVVAEALAVAFGPFAFAPVAAFGPDGDAGGATTFAVAGSSFPHPAAARTAIRPTAVH